MAADGNTQDAPRGHSPLLLTTAAFAFLWTIARAAVQSITIDEADTYLTFVEPSFPAHWAASANNHVLNSLLERLSTSIFGLSHLSLRAPALLGAFIYIGAAYFLCLGMSRRPVLRWSLFVCMVYNPFVMDFLVAARGYSLAVGFLLAAVAIAASAARGPGPWRDPVRACAAVSLLLGLSFAANFSFALVDAAVGLLVFWQAWRSAPSSQRARIAAAAILPGALAAAFLVGSVLAQSSQVELTHGATSLRETAKRLREDSLFEVNPFLVNPPLREALTRWNWLVPALLAAAGLWRLAVIAFHRRSPGDEHSRWLRQLGQTAAGALAAAIGVHWLLFRSIHLLLPKDRTALYIVPLGVLALGALAAFPLASRMGRLSARAAAGSLLLAAFYFLCCLRLTYFKEWRYDADIKDAYFAAAYYSRVYGVREIPTSWKYFASLNFYRVLSGREGKLRFETGPINAHTYRPDRQVYILEGYFDDPFVADQKLKIVYRGPQSEMMVAIRPSLEEQPVR